MLTPPKDLSGSSLVQMIERAWNLTLDSLNYCPVGFGSHHWVARSDVGFRSFVTVDELNSESHPGDEVSALGLHLRSALAAATDLRAFGCEFVVAPIPTKNGDVFTQSDRYAVTLYPLLDGYNLSAEERFGDSDRDRVLGMVIELHRVPIAAIRPPAADAFVVPWLDQLDRSRSDLAESMGPYTDVTSQLLVDNEASIKRLIARYETIVSQYRRAPGPVVVTHGEIHPGNVMVTSKGWKVVDWDTVLIAPPERDLWRLAQESGSIRAAYAEAVGIAPRDEVIDLYAARWDLAEIASFAAEFQRPHEDTEDSRKALEILRSVVGRLRSQSA